MEEGVEWVSEVEEEEEKEEPERYEDIEVDEDGVVLSRAEKVRLLHCSCVSVLLPAGV